MQGDVNGQIQRLSKPVVSSPPNVGIMYNPAVVYCIPTPFSYYLGLYNIPGSQKAGSVAYGSCPLPFRISVKTLP